MKKSLFRSTAAATIAVAGLAMCHHARASTFRVGGSGNTFTVSRGADGSIYTDGAEVINLTNAQDAVVSLVAQWGIPYIDGDGTECICTDYTGVTGRTSQQMYHAANFAFDFDVVWKIGEGETTPYLRPYIDTPAYPAYLGLPADPADDTEEDAVIRANYDAWAQRYGSDALGAYEAVDLSQIKGVISVSAGDDLGALAPKAASGITYSEGEATIFVPASAGRFVKAVIGVAPPVAE